MKIGRLSPGEDKILKAVKDGKRSFTELKGDTGLPGSVLSDYLKHLQEKKLIKRDYKTRKYEIEKLGTLVETLQDLQAKLLNPELAQEWWKSTRIKFDKIKFTGILKKDLKSFQEVSDETYGLLFFCIRGLHELLIPSHLPRDQNYYVCVSKEGSCDIIPETFIKRYRQVYKDRDKGVEKTGAES